MKSWITTDFQERETSFGSVLKIGDVVERSKQHLVEDVFLMKFHEVDEFQRGKISEIPTFSKKASQRFNGVFYNKSMVVKPPTKYPSTLCREFP